jgi:hypothetical protein
MPRFMKNAADPRFRVGVLDIAAAVIVLVALFLPPRSSHVESAFLYSPGAKREERADVPGQIALLEGRLAQNPADQKAAEELARHLEELGQHDQAIRVGGAAAARGGAGAWRALRAVSYAHAERLELQPAFDYAERAVKACDKAGADCDAQDQIRLSLYMEELEAGVRAEKEGVDPRKQPERFRARIHELHPTSRFAPQK